MRQLLAAVTWLVLGLAVGAPAAEVALEVTDFAGVVRREWPVCGGVPFGQGELADVGGLELVDDRGAPVVLQCEPLARWEDGSVKWLLVDFFATLGPGQTRHYRLRPAATPAGDRAPAGPALVWKHEDRAVSIDTGVLRVRLGPRFLESVRVRRGAGEWAELVTAPGEMWTTVDGDNQGEYLASLDREPEIAVEQSGSNRVCVRISGWHTSTAGERFAPYVLRACREAGYTESSPPPEPSKGEK